MFFDCSMLNFQFYVQFISCGKHLVGGVVFKYVTWKFLGFVLRIDKAIKNIRSH